ncbi:MAG TPA: helix-turn-helix transcriptional regulator [Candidatus Binatia bacterium]|nr:helix-turn-helix transcriptional regulator [Candidatus Binatia bacterium]
MSQSRDQATTIVTVPAYLAAVRRLYGLGAGEMAKALRVSPSVLRRWTRGTMVPTWRRMRSMTTLWGGSAELLALGAAMQRYARVTGVSIDEAVRMVRSGRRNAPARPTARRVRDRRQLSLPIVR